MSSVGLHHDDFSEDLFSIATSLAHFAREAHARSLPPSRVMTWSMTRGMLTDWWGILLDDPREKSGC